MLSAVTVYNELSQIKSQGYEGDKLQVISPKEYNSAFLGDMLFSNEEFLKKNPELTKKFLRASLKGWKYTLENPEEALSIVLQSNSELDSTQQKAQLNEVIKLVRQGKSLTEGIGHLPRNEYQNIYEILKKSGQIVNDVNIDDIMDFSYWNSLPKADIIPE